MQYYVFFTQSCAGCFPSQSQLFEQSLEVNIIQAFTRRHPVILRPDFKAIFEGDNYNAII